MLSLVEGERLDVGMRVGVIVDPPLINVVWAEMIVVVDVVIWPCELVVVISSTHAPSELQFVPEGQQPYRQQVVPVCVGRKLAKSHPNNTAIVLVTF